MQRLLLDTATMAAPEYGGDGGGGSRQHGSYNKEANVDTNMVIILAALLCALICALGINSIVRCVLRCSRRLAFQTSDDAAVERLAAATGVKRRALRRFPVAVYGGGLEIPATECPICLGEFVDGEKVRVLPQCNHGFHVRCIDVWLASHSSCPTCRRLVVELPAVVVGRSRDGDGGGGGG
ncbi:hypothetical protein L6452_05325 [Arctium lappa]|uniref:Uncharacterized protein n=1 Tax=Arctium lappa TaxID=4217 RepID=A0ACB9EH56_ARCLA|nr:hypothetical protein L6452_05325 [Arctium lappa]